MKGAEKKINKSYYFVPIVFFLSVLSGWFYKRPRDSKSHFEQIFFSFCFYFIRYVQIEIYHTIGSLFTSHLDMDFEITQAFFKNKSILYSVGGWIRWCKSEGYLHTSVAMAHVMQRLQPLLLLLLLLQYYLRWWWWWWYCFFFPSIHPILLTNHYHLIYIYISLCWSEQWKSSPHPILLINISKTTSI